MTTEDSSTYNQKVIADFRANHGVVRQPDFPVLLLTTTGARTGRLRTTPLGYAVDRDMVFVVASNGGASTDPAWFHNLRANPSVTVELGSNVYEARAIVAVGEERDRLFAILSTGAPTLQAFKRRTTRRFPIVVLEGVPAPSAGGGSQPTPPVTLSQARRGRPPRGNVLWKPPDHRRRGGTLNSSSRCSTFSLRSGPVSGTPAASASWCSRPHPRAAKACTTRVMSSSIDEGQALMKRYGDHLAVDAAGLTIGEGELVGDDG